MTFVDPRNVTVAPTVCYNITEEERVIHVASAAFVMVLEFESNPNMQTSTKHSNTFAKLHQHLIVNPKDNMQYLTMIMVEGSAEGAQTARVLPPEDRGNEDEIVGDTQKISFLHDWVKVIPEARYRQGPPKVPVPFNIPNAPNQTLKSLPAKPRALTSSKDTPPAKKPKAAKRSADDDEEDDEEEESAAKKTKVRTKTGVVRKGSTSKKPQQSEGSSKGKGKGKATEDTDQVHEIQGFLHDTSLSSN